MNPHPNMVTKPWHWISWTPFPKTRCAESRKWWMSFPLRATPLNLDPRRLTTKKCLAKGIVRWIEIDSHQHWVVGWENEQRTVKKSPATAGNRNCLRLLDGVICASRMSQSWLTSFPITFSPWFLATKVRYAFYDQTRSLIPLILLLNYSCSIELMSIHKRRAHSKLNYVEIIQRFAIVL